MPLETEYKFLLRSVNSNWSYHPVTLGFHQIGAKSALFRPMWPWNLTDDLEKQYGSSLVPLKPVYKIWSQSVNSNWSYRPETPGFHQIGTFLARVSLKFDRWPWKTIGSSPVPLESVYQIWSRSVNSNWSYRPEMPQIGPNFIWPLWPWPLTYDLDLLYRHHSWPWL